MAIYFIQCGKNGPIKIGYTIKNPKERMAELQTACPYKLVLLWIYKGSDYTEASIHEELKHERIRGEWFRPGEDVLSFIKIKAANVYPIELNSGKSLLISERPNELIEVYIGLSTIYLNLKKKKIFIDSCEEVEIKKVKWREEKNNAI